MAAFTARLAGQVDQCGSVMSVMRRSSIGWSDRSETILQWGATSAVAPMVSYSTSSATSTTRSRWPCSRRGSSIGGGEPNRQLSMTSPSCSRSRATSFVGASPKKRPYSLLNCEALIYPTCRLAVPASIIADSIRRRDS